MYKLHIIRIVSSTMIEMWAATENLDDVPASIRARTEAKLLAKIAGLPGYMRLAFTLFSCLNIVYCIMKFGETGNLSFKQRTLLVGSIKCSWLSPIRDIGVFIEKITILYLMDCYIESESR